MNARALVAFVLLCFHASARADDSPLENSPLDLAQMSECVELAMYDLALCPGDYESLHDLLAAAKAAANSEEQIELLAAVDLTGGDVRVGEHLYTGRVIETGHDSYADGSTAYLFDYEITEISTGQQRTFAYQLDIP
jgi:hypothetical protein